MWAVTQGVAYKVIMAWLLTGIFDILLPYGLTYAYHSLEITVVLDSWFSSAVRKGTFVLHVYLKNILLTFCTIIGFLCTFLTHFTLYHL